MRLTIDARTIENSGIGVYLKSLLPYIVASGKFDICLLGEKKVLEEIGWNNVCECRAQIYSIKEQFEIPSKILRCDIFWSPHYNIPVLPIKAKKRVTTIHDTCHLAYPEKLSPLEKTYARTVLPLAARVSDKIITVSEFSKNEIIKYTRILPEKITVIHNGVDFGSFNKAKESKDVLRCYNLGQYILSVGNVKPHKNIIGLIDAFSILHRSFPDIKLVVVGEKAKFITKIDGLDRHIKRLGLEKHVMFTGFIDDVFLKILYKGAKVFVFPSFYEGFGLPPLEAMAASIPTVVSRAASIPEVCGKASVYVDPHNPRDIAMGIVRVMEDTTLRAILVEKGLKMAKAFSWEISAAKHIRLFEETYKIPRFRGKGKSSL